MSEPDHTRQFVSRPSSRRGPWVPALFGVVVGVVLMAAVVYLILPNGDQTGAAGPAGAAGGGSAAGGFMALPVEVTEAVETMAAEPVRLLGTAEPVRDTVVASEVEGVVAEVLADEGDSVVRDDVLARLRTTTIELELGAAKANRAEAAARLVKFETELDRLTDLLAREAISQQEYDQAVADRDAQAQTVVRYDAEAARLQELIDRAQITAPFAGRVTAVHVEVGEWVGRGGDVATLVDLSRVEVTVPVPERYVSQAEVARRERWELEVSFDALEGTFKGVVKAVIPEANPQARTFPALISIDNPDRVIQAGMLARVLAQVGDPVPTVLVPKDAVVLRSGRAYLYRTRQMPAPGGAGARGAPGESAGDNPGATEGAPGDLAPTGAPGPGGAGGMMMVEEIPVELGAGFGVWQGVSGPVSAGDLVVVRGNENLQAGMPVSIAAHVQLEPPPAASADLPIARRQKESNR